jgi:hypothetical protein
MQRPIAILCVLAGSIAGCKIHRLPALPADRDPAGEAAPVVPYRPPPDVLTTELSTGAPTPEGSGHEGHDMAPSKEGSGHEGHDMTPAKKASGHEGHDMPEPAPTKKAPAHEHDHRSGS